MTHHDRAPRARVALLLAFALAALGASACETDEVDERYSTRPYGLGGEPGSERVVGGGPAGEPRGMGLGSTGGLTLDESRRAYDLGGAQQGDPHRQPHATDELFIEEPPALEAIGDPFDERARRGGDLFDDASLIGGDEVPPGPDERQSLGADADDDAAMPGERRGTVPEAAVRYDNVRSESIDRSATGGSGALPVEDPEAGLRADQGASEEGFEPPAPQDEAEPSEPTIGSSSAEAGPNYTFGYDEAVLFADDSEASGAGAGEDAVSSDAQDTAAQTSADATGDAPHDLAEPTSPDSQAMTDEAQVSEAPDAVDGSNARISQADAPQDAPREDSAAPGVRGAQSAVLEDGASTGDFQQVARDDADDATFDDLQQSTAVLEDGASTGDFQQVARDDADDATFDDLQQSTAVLEDGASTGDFQQVARGDTDEPAETVETTTRGAAAAPAGALAACQQAMPEGVTLAGEIDLGAGAQQGPVSLRISEPRAGTLIEDDTLVIEVALEGYPTSEGAAHVHVIIDDLPYEAYYDAGREAFVVDSAALGLAPGAHIVRAFPSSPWHESVKQPEAFATTWFYYRDASAPAPTADLEGPMLTYSRPRGVIEVSPSSNRVLLDYFVSNIELAPGGHGVRVTLDDGTPLVIPAWMPIWLEGLTPGEHRIKLELVDADGRLVPGRFNVTERTFSVQPASTSTADVEAPHGGAP